MTYAIVGDLGLGAQANFPNGDDIEIKFDDKTLMEKDEDQEEFVQQIALKTDGFTNISASACTELCKNLAEIIAQYGE